MKINHSNKRISFRRKVIASSNTLLEAVLSLLELGSFSIRVKFAVFAAPCKSDAVAFAWITRNYSASFVEFLAELFAISR